MTEAFIGARYDRSRGVQLMTDIACGYIKAQTTKNSNLNNNLSRVFLANLTITVEQLCYLLPIAVFKQTGSGVISKLTT